MKHSLRLLTLAAAALLAAATVPSSPAASESPEGDWDFVIGGKQRGVAFLSFEADGGVTGLEVVRPIKPSTPKKKAISTARGVLLTDNPRGGAGSSSTNSSSATTVTNLIGSTTLNGLWTYDTKGFVIGFVAYTIDDRTEGFSFKGTARAGVRFNFTAHSPYGTLSYKGVPQLDLADMDGGFFASTRRGGVPSYDFFTLVQDGGQLNAYAMTNGVASSFAFTGGALVSRQKQIAIVTISDEDDSTLSAYAGSFSLTTKRGSLTGVSIVEDSEKYTYGVSYKIAPRP